MHLRALQKHILRSCFLKGRRVERGVFLAFYGPERKDSVKHKTNNITKSIESLISNGLLIGFGKRTEQKWFITHVKLTAKGKKVAQEVVHGKQTTLLLT